MGQYVSPRAVNGAGWEISQVPLAAIETELEKLWKSVALETRQAARGAAEDQDGASTASAIAGIARAHVLNFVAYTSGQAEYALEGENAADVVESIAATHPFRTILIVADEGSEAAEINATARAMALDGTDGRKIVHELVRIDARGPVSAGLPSVVLPLLLPDLPTFLWWPGDLPINHAFWPRMVDASDHLIVDSGTFASPLASIAQCADFMRASKKHQTFADLAWNRLSDWRGLVSQLFDNPSSAGRLDRIASVTIEFATRRAGSTAHVWQANPAVALLFAGWLSSRLTWDVASGRAEQGVVRYELTARDGSRVDMALKPRISTGPLAAVESVCIDTDEGERSAHFAVVQERDRPVAQVLVSVPNAGDLARPVGLVAADRATLLARELDRGMKDRPYEEAVAAAALMARRIDENQT